MRVRDCDFEIMTAHDEIPVFLIIFLVHVIDHFHASLWNFHDSISSKYRKIVHGHLSVTMISHEVGVN